MKSGLTHPGRRSRVALIFVTVLLSVSLAAAQSEPPPAAPPPPSGSEVIPRDSLPPPSPRKPKKVPRDNWSTSIGGGLSLSQGNSDDDNLNLNLDADWNPKTIRSFKAEFIYIMKYEDGEKTTDKTSGLLRYDRLWKRWQKAYSFGEVTYNRDLFKDIRFLVSPRVGIGYKVAKSKTLTLAVDLSGGIATEQNLAGERSTGIAVKVGETFEQTFGKEGATKVTEKASALFKTGDFNDTIYHADFAVRTGITRHLDLKITYIWDYKTQPDYGDLLNSDVSLIGSILVKW